MNAVKINYLKFKQFFITEGHRVITKRNFYLSPLCVTIICIFALNILTGCGKFEAETSVPGATPTPTPGTIPNIDVDREPELPRKYLSTTYVPSTKPPTTVAAGANLQVAINNAQPGDTLMLEAGATFTGNFILPRKTGDDFIVIRSAADNESLPPEGTRINPSYSNVMPKLVSPNSRSALGVENGAHHYRFIGVEFTVDPNVEEIFNIVFLHGGDDVNSLDDLAHDLIFDRVYVHGNSVNEARRGFALNSASTAIIDSYISEIHEHETDSQGILGWNGPGPFKIVNNYIEAAGENVMFGGAPASIPNLIPSDIEFRRNHCFKPLRWFESDPSYGDVHWAVKNLFEIKNGQRILVDGNIFENTWADYQKGFALLFTVRTEEGKMPWAVAKDITFSNNIIKHAAGGIAIAGYDNESPHDNKGISSHIKFFNNLFDDINGPKWGGQNGIYQGIFIKLVGGPPYLRFIHNTVVNSGKIGSMEILPKGKGLYFKDNIAFRNELGFYGDDYAEGTTALDYYYPGSIFTGNIIIGGPESSYPAGNFFPTLPFDLGFRDNGNNQYTPVDTIIQRGSDGKKPGVDIDVMNIGIYGKTTF